MIRICPGSPSMTMLRFFHGTNAQMSSISLGVMTFKNSMKIAGIRLREVLRTTQANSTTKTFTLVMVS